MTLTMILVAFGVGGMVGLTGMGSGAILTPILILFFGVSPSIAVGTDIVQAAIYKVVGALLYAKSRQVNWALTRWLLYTSLPGALIGASLVVWLKHKGSVAVADLMIRKVLGGVLILGAISIIARWLLRQKREGVTRTPAQAVAFIPSRREIRGVATCSLLVGVIVGMTSVGSGSLMEVCLLLLLPSLPSRVIIGTNMVNAVALEVVPGIVHAVGGNVSLSLMGTLLIGSVPGIFFGVRISRYFPDGLLRAVLAFIMLILGWKLVGATW